MDYITQPMLSRMIYENMRQHDKVQQSDDEEKFLFIISNNSTNSPIQ